jgi:hypothetical protein
MKFVWIHLNTKLQKNEAFEFVADDLDHARQIVEESRELRHGDAVYPLKKKKSLVKKRAKRTTKHLS